MSRLNQFLSNSYESLKTTSHSIVQASRKTIAEHPDKIIPLAIAAVAVGGTILLICKARAAPTVRQVTNSSHTIPTEKESSLSTCSIDILRLPAETRVQIWKLLSYKETLKLRLVTDAFKEDIDTLVGLRMTLNKKRKPEQYAFAKRIALQESRVMSVEDSINPNGFFYDAYLMRRLEVSEKYGPISVWNISALMKHCVNLTHLKLRLFHMMESELNEISRILITSVLGKLTHLVHLEFARYLSRPLPHLRAKITPKKHYGCPKNLQVFILEAPELSDAAVYSWRYLLEQQTSMKTFIFNVGAIHWDFFETLIPKNALLETVRLQGLKNTHLEGEDFKTFDWGIFKNCTNLQDIHVCSTVTVGQFGSDKLSAKNFNLIPCAKLEHICITRIILSAEDVRRIYHEMVNLKRGYLDHIGDEGMAMAAVVSGEVNANGGFEDDMNLPWFTDDNGGLYFLALHTLVLACGIIGMGFFSSSIEAIAARLAQNQDNRRQQ